MKNDPIELVAEAAATLVDSDGLRAGAGLVAGQITRSLPAQIAFIALRRRDSSVADLIAASGLGAADFRRLESRITKSSLWRILTLAGPVAIDNLGGDNVLNFLAFGTGTNTILAVPITLRGRARGLLAVGFAPNADFSEAETVKTLDIIAAMFAQAIRAARRITDESQKLAEENTHLKQELKEKYDFSRLIGNSSGMRTAFDQASQIARSNATVLLRGETGTGKQTIAGTIHHNSLRSKRPFIKVNCAAIPDALIENELFGREQEALSGGPGQKKGRVEQADGGTLFLDEVGGLPMKTQDKLLRLIETGEFERPGGTETVRSNIRLITASNQDLEHAVAIGGFRKDLFRRLSSFTIFLPPLRERKSDILLLAEHFLEKYEREHKKDVRRISTPAIDMLTAYHFPGNVRELENVIERAVIDCDSNVIHGHDLPPTLQTAEVSGTETRVTLASAVEAFERDLIQDTLKSTRGNVAKAAIMLDSTERILGYKIKKYGLNPRRFASQKPDRQGG